VKYSSGGHSIVGREPLWGGRKRKGGGNGRKVEFADGIHLSFKSPKRTPSLKTFKAKYKEKFEFKGWGGGRKKRYCRCARRVIKTSEAPKRKGGMKVQGFKPTRGRRKGRKPDSGLLRHELLNQNLGVEKAREKAASFGGGKEQKRSLSG